MAAPGLLSAHGGSAHSQEVDLKATLAAWETAADRVTGRIVVTSTLRQFFAMERTTEGAVLKGRPSMATDRAPTRIRYKRLPRTAETRGRISYQVEAFNLTLDLDPAPADPAKRFAADWDGQRWTEGRVAGRLAEAASGDGAMRGPFGILLTAAFRDAAPGLRFADLIRTRPCVIAREGDLLKIHAPAKAGTPMEGSDYTVWLSPAKGMLPERWERGAPGGPIEIRVENRLEEMQPGVWVPVKIAARMFVADESSPSRGKVVFQSEQEVDRSSSRMPGAAGPASTGLSGSTPWDLRRGAGRWALASAAMLPLGFAIWLARNQIKSRRNGRGRAAQ
jgi:hypothetical protein